jgi:hypothetical protein
MAAHTIVRTLAPIEHGSAVLFCVCVERNAETLRIATRGAMAACSSWWRLVNVSRKGSVTFSEGVGNQ